MKWRRIALPALVALAAVLPMLATAQGRRAGGQGRPKPEIGTDGLKRDSTGNVIFTREVFGYAREGRRDPFSSLIETGDIRPLLQDLQVVAITVSGTERLSVATLKDVSTGDIYRVRVGSVFGRLRVVGIRQREIVVAIDEFGNTRQETLSINVPVGGGRTP
jgi:hypothetical protein